MRNRKRNIAGFGVLVVSGAVLGIVGCTMLVDDPGGSSSTAVAVAGTTATFGLGEAATFDVEADVAAKIETEVAAFEEVPMDEPLAAFLSIRPEAIRVGPATSAKTTVAASPGDRSGATGRVTIRVVVGEVGDFSPFTSGEDLGTIEVSVVDGVVTSVSRKLPIPKALLSIFLDKFFAVGMELLADFPGTIAIDDIDVEFGMTEDDPDAPTERRACCFARNGPGQCLDIGFIDALRTAEDCAEKLGGVALAAGTRCSELPCNSSEACCMRDGECEAFPVLDCRDRAGVSQGPGTQCGSVVCVPDPSIPQDCSVNGNCNIFCPDIEPDPDCSNEQLCAAKTFCCPSDLVCDIQRCNGLDPECTNLLFCDRLGGCCDDDDVCETGVDGRECPQADEDCAFCGIEDDVCIRGCASEDPDCADDDSCPQDDRCEADCAGEDPDCALCAADALGTCVTDCDPPDPDCLAVTNITAEGTPFASSVFDDATEFLPIRATDGTSGTNWFSDGKGGDGPDADSESFTWLRNLSGNTSITRIETDPETFPDGAFGFLQVQVVVFNSADIPVFDSGALTMAGSRVDLNVSLPEGVEGNRVVLTLIIHESASCGGFSEFRVFGLRD